MNQKSRLGGVFDTEGETGGRPKQGARGLAKEVGGMLTENAEARADRKKHDAVHRVDHVVSAMERFAGELHQNDEKWLGTRAASAAAGVRKHLR